MVAMKEIDIPKRCEKCKFCLWQRTNDYGSFGECLLQKDKRVNCLAWSKDNNCPLVEVVTCKDCKYWDEGKKYCKQTSSTIEWVDYSIYKCGFLLWRWKKKGQWINIRIRRPRHNDANNINWQKNKEMNDLV